MSPTPIDIIMLIFAAFLVLLILPVIIRERSRENKIRKYYKDNC